MLSKELRNEAENMAEKLRPVFALLYKLGKKYDETRNEWYKAQSIAHSWQYPDEGRDWEYIRQGTQTKEEREAIRATYQRSRPEWRDTLEGKYKEMHQAETAHTVARSNFTNYINYAAHLLGDMIRPKWREFVERRGLETLAEIINEKNPRKDRSAGACQAALYLRNAELLSDRATPGQYARIEAAIYTGWACGISGECCRYYQINADEVWHYAKEPQILTLKQYETAAAKAAKMMREIEEKATALSCFVGSRGLYGFIEIADVKKVI